MTPDAAGTQPGKRSWKRWMAALACGVGVITIALWARTARKEPFAIRCVGHTNYNGQTMLVFQGANGIPSQVEYFACVVTGATHHTGAPIHDAETLSAAGPFYSQFESNTAESTFYFDLQAPPNGAPCYVMWAFHDRVRQSRWELFRMGCFAFFGSHDMPALAQRFAPKFDIYYIEFDPHYTPSAGHKE